MSELSLECNTCHESSPLSTSKSVTQRGTSYDINRRAVYRAIETGSGYEGLAAFCSIMNMPCLTKAAYYKQVENILEALENEANEEMRNAAERLRQHILDENPEKDEQDILDTAISFDGTWAKRGFTSLTGVVFAISVDTGEVLDYHVSSKSCLKCPLKKENAVMKCLKSGCLNTSVILTLLVAHQPWRVKELVLWGRSIDHHNLRYKWMVCDGDSKAFNSVEHVYGETKVEKLDCVGHVQRRMGKHLLNLKSRTKGKLADGQPMGGRERLTAGKIKQLQNYYGLDIRQNTIKKSNPTRRDVDVAVYSMKKNIIAILHRVKSDSAKLHRFCPPGESSWCRWRQDEATGTSTYKDHDCLPEVFLEVLCPTFMTLSDEKLLERCVLGTTQNPNE